MRAVGYDATWGWERFCKEVKDAAQGVCWLCWQPVCPDFKRTCAAVYGVHGVHWEHRWCAAGVTYEVYLDGLRNARAASEV